MGKECVSGELSTFQELQGHHGWNAENERQVVLGKSIGGQGPQQKGRTFSFLFKTYFFSLSLFRQMKNHQRVLVGVGWG